MKPIKKMNWVVGIAAALVASIVLLPKANAELVYENNDQAQTEQAQDTANSRSQERDAMRQALGASEKAQATIQAQQPVQVTQPVQIAQQPQQPTMRVVLPATPAGAQVAVETAPVTAQAAAPQAEVQNLSRSELLRRERVREELKNEDLLEERLEELRLQDEKKRTEQLLNGSQPLADSGAADAAPQANQAMANQAMKDEVVPVPITETPGKPADTKAGAVVASATLANPPASQDQITVSSASAVSASAISASDVSDRVTFSIQPWAGLSSMSNSLSYTVRPHYSAGIGLGLGVSDNLTFELGYQYSEYGITASSMNPYVLAYQAWANANSYGSTGAFETQTFRQNLAEGGLKLYFLGPSAKLRPFLIGGAAYSVGFINYSSATMALLQQYYGQSYGLQDYTLSSFLGYVGAGMDVRLNKNLSVGANFRYYSVLSTNESQNLNNMALYSPASYWANADQQLTGGTLAIAGFYSITGGVSFTF